MELNSIESEDGILSPAQRATRCAVTLFCLAVLVSSLLYIFRSEQTGPGTVISSIPVNVEQQTTIQEGEEVALLQP